MSFLRIFDAKVEKFVDFNLQFGYNEHDFKIEMQHPVITLYKPRIE